MDMETKYTIAKSWIAEIIVGSYVNGDPRFKDENYKEVLTPCFMMKSIEML